MKKFRLFKGALLFFAVLFAQTSLAQDYTRLNLPEGAFARLGGKGHLGPTVYSPGGMRIAVASSIGIWLYDAHTGAEIALFTGHTKTVRSVSFSPDGNTLASGDGWPENTIRLWDVASGQEKAILRGHRFGVNSVSFSPDGNTLASASSDDTIRLWDVASGQEKAILRGHRFIVNSVSFSPDGNTLASASEDSTLVGCRQWARKGHAARTYAADQFRVVFTRWQHIGKCKLG